MSKIAARKLIRAWSNALAAVGSTTDSKVMEKYMKGIAPFFGVKSVERRKLAEECSSTCIGKKWNWDLLVMIVDHAFEANEREIHYCGVDLAKSKLAKRWIAEMDSSVVALAVNGPLRRWITSKSWWDTVDALASNVAGAFWMHHTEIMRCCMIEWLQHDNIWLRRSAILCQLHCKTLTDEAFLFDSCVSCFGTNEFFINKAIGWALRTYARVNADAVQAFVEKHEKYMHKLSKREALKHIRKGDSLKVTLKRHSCPSVKRKLPKMI